MIARELFYEHKVVVVNFICRKTEKKQLKERLQYAVTQNKSDQETKKEKEI